MGVTDASLTTASSRLPICPFGPSHVVHTPGVLRNRSQCGDASARGSLGPCVPSPLVARSQMQNVRWYGEEELDKKGFGTTEGTMLLKWQTLVYLLLHLTCQRSPSLWYTAVWASEIMQIVYRAAVLGSLFVKCKPSAGLFCSQSSPWGWYSHVTDVPCLCPLCWCVNRTALGQLGLSA